MSIIKTEDCPICGQSTSAMEKSSAKFNGLYLCKTCAKALGSSGVFLIGLDKKHSLEELRNIVGVYEKDKEEHEIEIAEFNATKKIGNYVYFDDANKKFAIPKVTLTGKVKDLKIFNYEDILDFELLEDGNSVSKGGVGRAIVGGALFGGVGAIVGGSTGHKMKNTCSKLQIKLTFNNIESPTAYINFIVAETKKDSFIYKQTYPMAQDALSVFNIICQDNPQKDECDNQQGDISAADEILKFKQLLDNGIITQEEFEAKKKQLLGL
ncbi:MAG: SHOCT domain-containing protein [Lachnospiraceae bacterium]|nr:SHOCT domain-containing protein [Lachnospiraceae bacterium]